MKQEKAPGAKRQPAEQPSSDIRQAAESGGPLQTGRTAEPRARDARQNQMRRRDEPTNREEA